MGPNILNKENCIVNNFYHLMDEINLNMNEFGSMVRSEFKTYLSYKTAFRRLIIKSYSYEVHYATNHSSSRQ